MAIKKSDMNEKPIHETMRELGEKIRKRNLEAISKANAYLEKKDAVERKNSKMFKE